MKLSDLTLPIAYKDAQGLALLFGPALATRLAQLHAQFGSANCVPVPRTLTDGRFMLSADILTEVTPGRLLHAMWQAADKAVLLPNVEVVPIANAVSLLPATVETANSTVVPGGGMPLGGGGLGGFKLGGK